MYVKLKCREILTAWTYALGCRVILYCGKKVCYLTVIYMIDNMTENLKIVTIFYG